VAGHGRSQGKKSEEKKKQFTGVLHRWDAKTEGIVAQKPFLLGGAKGGGGAKKGQF